MKNLKLCCLLIVFISCGRNKEFKPPDPTAPSDSTQLKWKGDNMTDFKAEGLSVSSIGSGLFPRVPYEERKVV